ncbi:MAG: amidohydrolase family protein [Candidatus Sumerlaeaceae bacterium]
MATLLENVTLVEYCPPRVVPRCSILVEGDSIVNVFEKAPVPSGIVGSGECVDCSGLLAMPALVVGHTHLYSSLATGLPAPRKTPTNFVEILEEIWWKLDRALDEEGIYYSALVGAVRGALCGAGTLIDHHASPSCIRGSLGLVRRALERVGLRGVLCYEVTDRNGLRGSRDGLDENADFLANGRIQNWYAGLVGAHASFTLGDDALHKLAELADHYAVGIHIHCAEAESDNQDALQRCGQRVIGRLAQAGILRPGTVLAHCTHLTADEIRLAYDLGCWIAHNPRSNMNNGVGYARIEELSRGRLALGTDGIDADMFSESKTAFFKMRDVGARLPFDAPLRWLGGAAQLASELLDIPLGLLRPGTPADLVLLDYPAATPLTSENLAGHWFFCFAPGFVHSTMVAGQWLVRNHKLVDERLYEELDKAQRLAQVIWDRFIEL